jgi:hypothetical protein
VEIMKIKSECVRSRRGVREGEKQTEENAVNGEAKSKEANLA